MALLTEIVLLLCYELEEIILSILQKISRRATAELNSRCLTKGINFGGLFLTVSFGLLSYLDGKLKSEIFNNKKSL